MIALAKTYTFSIQALPANAEEFSTHLTPDLGLNKTTITFDSSRYRTSLA